MPYQFKRISWTLFETSPTFVVAFILSFIIVSSCVTPHIHRSIHMSATSNLLSCALINVNVSARTTALSYQCPVTLHVILMYFFLSHNTPYILFQFFQTLCTRRRTSSSHYHAPSLNAYIGMSSLFLLSLLVNTSTRAFHPNYPVFLLLIFNLRSSLSLLNS